MTYENLTRTEAQRIAERTRRSGYFKPDLYSYFGAYVICLLCGDRIGVAGPQATEVHRQMMIHLLSAYDDDRCSHVTSVRKGSEIR